MANMKMFILVGGLCFLISCDAKRQGGSSRPQAYPVMRAEVGDVILESVYPVTIKGKEDIEIRPRIDGFIDEVHIDEGDVVRAGQVLFVINSPQARQSLEMARAAVTVAEAQVNTAFLNLRRMSPLAEKNIISGVQLETYQYAYSSAVAAKEQAEASLRNAEATLGWTSVTSPVDGVVGALPYRLGSLVNSQNVLTVVSNTSTVFAYFSLSEKALAGFLGDMEGSTQAEKISHAPPVTLTLADGSVYPAAGRLETITGALNTATGSAGFRVEFPNSDGQLRSGASGRISMPRALDGVIVIPQKATFAQQDKVLVYKVEADSVVQRVISVIPTTDAKGFVVTAGLEEGDMIVADGVATLSNGKKIAVAE